MNLRRDQLFLHFLNLAIQSYPWLLTFTVAGTERLRNQSQGELDTRVNIKFEDSDNTIRKSVSSPAGHTSITIIITSVNTESLQKLKRTTRLRAWASPKSAFFGRAQRSIASRCKQAEQEKHRNQDKIESQRQGIRAFTKVIQAEELSKAKSKTSAHLRVTTASRRKKQRAKEPSASRFCVATNTNESRMNELARARVAHGNPSRAVQCDLSQHGCEVWWWRSEEGCVGVWVCGLCGEESGGVQQRRYNCPSLVLCSVPYVTSPNLEFAQRFE